MLREAVIELHEASNVDIVQKVGLVQLPATRIYV